MRVLIAGSDVEGGSGGLLADAVANASPSSGSQGAETEGNAALRILFDRWVKQHRSLTRIGSYGTLSEVYESADSLLQMVDRK